VSIDEETFKNVSVITAKNRDKDLINKASAMQFANETGQKLYSFYSIDTLSTINGPARSVTFGNKRKVFSSAKAITHSDQVALWDQLPHTSDHEPACLHLCFGMPVLIRNNNATDLCITKGQEAQVVGWTFECITGFNGRVALDVLFVELVQPPHSVKLPHLP
jgi:hypothetical protein